MGRTAKIVGRTFGILIVLVGLLSEYFWLGYRAGEKDKNKHVIYVREEKLEK